MIYFWSFYCGLYFGMHSSDRAAEARRFFRELQKSGE